MHYSGAQAKMEANAGLYQHLVKTAELMGEHNEYAEIIHRGKSLLLPLFNAPGSLRNRGCNRSPPYISR